MDLLVSLVVGCGQLAEVDTQSRSACPPLGEGGSPEQGAGGSLSVLGDAYSIPDAMGIFVVTGRGFKTRLGNAKPLLTDVGCDYRILNKAIAGPEFLFLFSFFFKFTEVTLVNTIM